MKIALIHDHLAQDGGAERVLQVLREIYPQAPIFTLIFDRQQLKSFGDADIRTSFLQKMPLGVSRYQWWLGWMPAAIESHDLRDYDLVISSASAFAKGVLTKPGARHICYCHTPTRYLWTDTHDYVRELRVNPLIKMMLPTILNRLRVWDRLAADRVDVFVANSYTVADRIKKYYNQASQVIYPPVEVDKFRISESPKKYYLAGGRLVPYKRIDLAVRAFARLGIPLKVFGVGPEMSRLKKMSQVKGNKSNIEFLGRVSEEEKINLFANCIAYLNPQEEDFGITAVEAMASGRPVIAYRAGGARETIREGETGEFFDDQWWEDIADKVIRFKEWQYRPEIIRSHAQRFSRQEFVRDIQALVDSIIQEKIT